MSAQLLIEELATAADPLRAQALRRFFKTGPGEYGAGDVFLGITVPLQRRIAKRYGDLPLLNVKRLLKSAIHEHRLTALLILVDQFKRTDARGTKRIVELYLASARRVNNWDLVDTSAPYILGEFFCTDRTCATLKNLARSENLWERRIAIVATLALIRKGRFDITIRIARMLRDDSHDLIHKAVGWMLREVGKKDEPTLKKFLDVNAGRMPRTMLRYAIERLSERERKQYMNSRRLTATRLYQKIEA